MESGEDEVNLIPSGRLDSNTGIQNCAGESSYKMKQEKNETKRKKKTLSIRTYNVRTHKEIGKLHLLTRGLDNRNVKFC